MPKTSREVVSVIKSTLEQLRADRAADMPKTALFSVYTRPQLDAIEGVLSLLLEADALGAEALADVDDLEGHGDADIDSREARQRLKEISGTEDIRKVPRR
jgi:hypothetical protein